MKKSVKKVALVSLALISTGLTSSAFAQQKTQIEFWTWYLSPKFDNFIKGVIADFEKQNPNITVKWLDKQDTIERDFQATIALGQAPDVVNLWNDSTAAAVQNNLLVPITDLTPLSTLNRLYYSNVLNIFKHDSKFYGYPWYGYVDQGVMMYNSELLQKAGVSISRIRTLDDLLNASKTIKDKTGAYGWLPPVSDPNGASFLAYFYLDGLPITNASGQAVFNSPTHAALLQKYVDLMKGDYIPQDLLRKEAFQVTNELYSQGKVAFMVGGPQSLNRVRDSNKDIYSKTKITSAPLGKAKVQTGGAFSLVIPRASKHQKEAALFALFMTNNVNQVKFANVVPIVPTTKAAKNDPSFKTTSQDPIEIATARVAGTGGLINPGFASPKNTDVVYKNFNDNIQAAFLGRKTAQQALNDAVTFWNANAK
ncbi:ABC transporter substrate-binding protein [Deinococcus yavapaiensis]|uniref:Carbohydrate ABC transporter substrate-binding protein (CUT1 family) n=1 Tax=Deinococcus yavapaiensis KR-236 TaxID=694435 RepID=A0A318S8M1_9DEIO|nr:sugar ABC transporter substrate-binding protein [Deinococcus yavapaiensis]PYE55396.1 carbohydrate ABC transporter substrate-binding protein (CUT1 family) [Deinococcus yavapaiensis KR-236]